MYEYLKLKHKHFKILKYCFNRFVKLMFFLIIRKEITILEEINQHV